MSNSRRTGQIDGTDERGGYRDGERGHIQEMPWAKPTALLTIGHAEQAKRRFQE